MSPGTVSVDQPAHGEQEARTLIYNTLVASGYVVHGMTDGIFGVSSPQQPDLFLTVTLHRTPVIHIAAIPGG